MDALYFAYGSNLWPARLRERVPSARPGGLASLSGHRLSLDKRSRDGSAKANLRPVAEGRVQGVLYRLSAIHWPLLDACEPDYRRVAVEVEAVGGRVLAQTYLSRVLTPDPVAFHWYKDLIVAGAQAHGLPPAWLAFLRSLPSRDGKGDRDGAQDGARTRA